jgi:hypothetical protein
MNDVSERMRNEEAIVYVRYPSISPKNLRKTTKVLSRSSCRDQTQGVLEFEVKLLTTRPLRSVERP